MFLICFFEFGIYKTMYQVTKIIHFCYGHRLLAYQGMCQHPHGHNGKVEILLESERLDSRGMVVDFSDINLQIKKWIDETLDHRMILAKGDPLIPFLENHHEPYFLMEGNPTAENIAKLIFEYTRSQKFPVKQVTLWETGSSFATYKQ